MRAAIALRKQSSGLAPSGRGAATGKNCSTQAFSRPKANCRVLRTFAKMRQCIVLVALLLVAAGCGRKATRADCELVVDRNIEVKLRADGVSDPDTIQKRKDELRGSLKEDIDRCVGKRVTDSMMACVRTAETAEQIDKCLR